MKTKVGASPPAPIGRQNRGGDAHFTSTVVVLEQIYP